MQERPNPVTPNPTATVNPNQASLDELTATEFAGPIAMLNLLRYDDAEGRETYGRYAQVAAGTIAAVGGSLMYLGRVIDPDEWDSIALIYYPSTEAYLAMQHDQTYVNAIPDRTAGLRARLLCPFILPDIDGQEAAELIQCNGSDTMEAQLIRRRGTPETRDGGDSPNRAEDRCELRLRSVGSGLVTDVQWDELALRPYASDDGHRSADERDVADVAVIVSQLVEQV